MSFTLLIAQSLPGFLEKSPAEHGKGQHCPLLVLSGYSDLRVMNPVLGTAQLAVNLLRSDCAQEFRRFLPDL